MLIPQMVLNGRSAKTKPCLDTSKWWINEPSKTIWMDLNGACSTACYQHCSNGITMCVQNQWAFLKVEILNGFKWSISRRINNSNTMCGKSVVSNRHLCTMSIACVLADNKMANISLNVGTFIAQNLPKYRFHSSLDYTFLSFSESSIIF